MIINHQRNATRNKHHISSLIPSPIHTHIIQILLLLHILPHNHPLISGNPTLILLLFNPSISLPPYYNHPSVHSTPFFSFFRLSLLDFDSIQFNLVQPEFLVFFHTSKFYVPFFLSIFIFILFRPALIPVYALFDTYRYTHILH